jgi:anti-sigma regulatory factor (Ser/Thr protein kinase)
MGAFPRVAALVEEACTVAGLPRVACLRLTLALEELFTNTVVHGHGGDSDHPVAITVEVEPGRIAVTYEDTAPPHDPFAALRPPGGGGVEDRPVGGLGVLLVDSVVERHAYARVGGRNRISLVMSAGR